MSLDDIKGPLVDTGKTGLEMGKVVLDATMSKYDNPADAIRDMMKVFMGAVEKMAEAAVAGASPAGTLLGGMGAGGAKSNPIETYLDSLAKIVPGDRDEQRKFLTDMFKNVDPGMATKILDTAQKVMDNTIGSKGFDPGAKGARSTMSGGSSMAALNEILDKTKAAVGALVDKIGGGKSAPDKTVASKPIVTDDELKEKSDRMTKGADKGADAAKKPFETMPDKLDGKGTKKDGPVIDTMPNPTKRDAGKSDVMLLNATKEPTAAGKSTSASFSLDGLKLALSAETKATIAGGVAGAKIDALAAKSGVPGAEKASAVVKDGLNKGIAEANETGVTKMADGVATKITGSGITELAGKAGANPLAPLEQVATIAQGAAKALGMDTTAIEKLGKSAMETINAVGAAMAKAGVSGATPSTISQVSGPNTAAQGVPTKAPETGRG